MVEQCAIHLAVNILPARSGLSIFQLGLATCAPSSFPPRDEVMLASEVVVT